MIFDFLCGGVISAGRTSGGGGGGGGSDGSSSGGVSGRVSFTRTDARQVREDVRFFARLINKFKFDKSDPMRVSSVSKQPEVRAMHPHRGCCVRAAGGATG